ncbi:MAG: 1-(5-phosphoribosyl)-5-[(5-phosphoribosylamino)methylideneamino]imidazole-4-carboxamide isomerase [Endozoicomonadaceae bacterium]|nr:1-(5-phosphoribosyl)-5-[(5-phosphoribosylamino)methylideneamino]imidazole-4-carboxamide isomerase [Endozoicomonadaceae bacterium]
MIIPSVDLINGQVVRLYQGDYTKQTVYTSDPVDLFKSWIDQGASRLHLVDLTGAEHPEKRQITFIENILTHLPASIQVGGGIRTTADIAALFSAGAQRVVLGSVAVTEPEKVREWLTRWGGEAIVLALDVRIHQSQKMVAINGWKKDSQKTLESVMQYYANSELKHVLCTDISRDGALAGSNVALYKTLAEQYPDIAWQASGGVSDLAHIASLKQSGVAAVITGRALLEKKFTYKEALQCWQNA